MQAFGRDQSGTGRIVSTVRMQNVPCLVLVLAALAYLVPGILGHDPWKQDETYTFGTIYHRWTNGDGGIAVNSGRPFMETPALYAWVAAGFARRFSPWVPLHDGARLASAFFRELKLG